LSKNALKNHKAQIKPDQNKNQKPRMDLYYKNLASEDPFRFRGRVLSKDASPESPKGPSQAEVIKHRESAIESELEAAKIEEEIKEIVMEEMKETGVFENPSTFALLTSGKQYDRLIEAAKALNKAYKNRKEAPEEYRMAKNHLTETLSKGDFSVTESDLRALVQLNQQAEERILLMELKTKKDKDWLKKHSACFLTGANLTTEGRALMGKSTRIFEKGEKLEPGTYTVNFFGNKSAETHVTLANLSKNIDAKTIDVRTKSGEIKTAKKGPKGIFNEGLNFGDPNYVPILNGDEILIAIQTSESLFEIQEPSIPTDSELERQIAQVGRERKNTGPATTTSAQVTPDMLGSVGKSPGRGRHLETTTYSDLDHLAFLTHGPGGVEAGVEAVMATEVSEEENYFFRLRHRELNLPAEFEALKTPESIPDELQNLKAAELVDAMYHMNHGEPARQALDKIAEVYTTLTGKQAGASKIMFELMKKRLQGQGKETITFDELCQVVYGLKAEEIIGSEGSLYKELEAESSRTGEFATLRKFLEASSEFLTYLNAMSASEIDWEEIEALRANTKLTGDMATIDSFLTGDKALALDKNDSQPLVTRKIFNRKARRAGVDSINEDNVGLVKGRGKIDPLRMLSPQAAYRQLMLESTTFDETGQAVGDLGAFVTRINSLMELGHQRMKVLGLTEKESFSPIPLTAVREIATNPTAGITNDHRDYIIYGLAIENAMQLGIDQMSTQDYLRERYGDGAISNVIDALAAADTNLEITEEDYERIAGQVHEYFVGGLGVMIESADLDRDTIKAAFGGGFKLFPKRKNSPMLDFNIVGNIATWAIKGGGAGYSQTIILETELPIAPDEITLRGGLQADKDSFGINTQASAKWQLGEDSPWSVEGALGGGITFHKNGTVELLTASLGLDRDLGLVAAKKARELVEAQQDDIEAYNEYMQTVDELESDLFAMLPSGTSPEQKTALRNAALNTANELITQEFGELALAQMKFVQFSGAGVGYSAEFGDLRKDGLFLYTILSFKGKNIVLFSKPQLNMDATALELMKAEIAKKYNADGTAAIDLPGSPEYVEGHQESYDRAIEVANQESIQQIAQINVLLRPCGISLERKEDKIRMHVSGAEGFVRLYGDGQSPIEVMSDGENIDLVLHKLTDFLPHITTKQYPTETGGETTYTEIFITSNPDPNNIRTMRENASSHYEWYQTLDGSKSQILEVQDRVTGTDQLMTYAELEKILEGIPDEDKKQEMARKYVSNLSTEGAPELLKQMEVKHKELKLKVQRLAFNETITPSRREQLRRVVTYMREEGGEFEYTYERLFTEHLSYEDFAYREQGVEPKGLIALIVKAHGEMTRNDLNPGPPLSRDEIIHIHNMYTEATRHPYTEPPVSFNKNSFKSFLRTFEANNGDSHIDEALISLASKLQFDFYDDRWANLIANPSTIEEGSEMFVFVNETGVKAKTFYDETIHTIYGAIYWNASNPMDTLEQLGLTDDTGKKLLPKYRSKEAELKKMVVEVAKAIEHFSDEEEIVPTNLSFEEALYTKTGMKLINSNGLNTLYGKTNALELQWNQDNPSQLVEDNPQLAQEFARDILTLMRDGTLTKTIKEDFLEADGSITYKTRTITVRRETKVATGITDACKNLALLRSEEILIEGDEITETPNPNRETQDVEYRATRVMVRSQLQAEQSARFVSTVLGLGARNRKRKGSKEGDNTGEYGNDSDWDPEDDDGRGSGGGGNSSNIPQS
jgi:hypothetical protein